MKNKKLIKTTKLSFVNTVKNYFKNFKSNRDILLKSLKTSVMSILKIFLLHKLSNLKYFKPLSIFFKILLNGVRIQLLSH